MNRIDSIKIVAALALLAAACVPPPQSSAGGDGNTAVASGGGGSGGGTCAGACAHIIECGLGADDGTCPEQCAAGGYDAQTLAQFEAGSCQQVEQWLASGTAAPAESSGAIGCTAEGVYEVCDGEFCRDHAASAMGSGDTKNQAGLQAREKCSNHMSSMIISNSTNYRATLKRSCEVTSCR